MKDKKNYKNVIKIVQKIVKRKKIIKYLKNSLACKLGDKITSENAAK